MSPRTAHPPRDQLLLRAGATPSATRPSLSVACHRLLNAVLGRERAGNPPQSWDARSSKETEEDAKSASERPVNQEVAGSSPARGANFFTHLRAPSRRWFQILVPTPRALLDIRISYWVWSAVVVTRWGYESKFCCRRCATKRQLMSVGSCLLLGWWGFPWGMLITPLQLYRNLRASHTWLLSQRTWAVDRQSARKCLRS